MTACWSYLWAAPTRHFLAHDKHTKESCFASGPHPSLLRGHTFMGRSAGPLWAMVDFCKPSNTCSNHVLGRRMSSRTRQHSSRTTSSISYCQLLLPIKGANPSWRTGTAALWQPTLPSVQRCLPPWLTIRPHHLQQRWIRQRRQRIRQ